MARRKRLNGGVEFRRGPLAPFASFLEIVFEEMQQVFVLHIAETITMDLEALSSRKDETFFWEMFFCYAPY